MNALLKKQRPAGGGLWWPASRAQTMHKRNWPPFSTNAAHGMRFCRDGRAELKRLSLCGPPAVI